MKKNIFALMAAVVIIAQGVCFAGLHDYPNIAVLPFKNKAIMSNELNFREANLISEFVIEELLDSGRFNVIEREEMMAITDEYALAKTGLVDPSTAVQLGKLAGAKYLVAGSVAGVTLKESGASYDNSVVGGVGGHKHTVTANVTARIFDVETGRIVIACHGVGESSSAHVEFRLNVKKNTPYETTGYDETLEEEYVDTGIKESILTHTVKIGTTEVSQVQVHNAIAKAVTNLVFDKNHGLLAKMDGKAKKKY